MAVTHLVTPERGGGKRLVVPNERDLPDHRKSLTLSGEIRSYRNGREVVFVRLGFEKPWGFRVFVVDRKSALPLGTTHAETYEIATLELERELSELGVIQ